MNLIGEYSKNSTILLELLTKDEDNKRFSADFPPTATIEYFESNGLTQVEHVTLEEMELGRYIKAFLIPDIWNYGDYFITYEAVMDGVPYNAKERFQVSELFELLQQNKAQLIDVMQGVGNPSADNTTLYDQMKTLHSALGISSTIEVTDFTLLTSNNSYTTVIVNGSPVAGAQINVWSDTDPKVLVAQTTTDEGGHWSVNVNSGAYAFEFIHPNGTLLRTLTKKVM